MDSQRAASPRRVVQVDRITLMIHLAVHVLAVGLATAAVGYMLGSQLSLSTISAAVFVLFAVAILPAQLVFNQIHSGKPARVGSWLLLVLIVGFLIFVANHLRGSVSWMN